MKNEIISQYKASIKMLMDTIIQCPEATWYNNDSASPYWRLVYHAIYFTALYLSQNPDRYLPWHGHQDGYENLGSLTRDKKPIIVERIYTKEEMLEYTESLLTQCKNSVMETEPDEQSGFYWLPMSRMEVHLYNIRHIQHHTGQLIERLHQAGIKGIKWEKMG
jgi:hypothetical protein